MTLSLPAGPLTPHAAYYLLKGRHPLVTLHGFDGSTRISLMGGTAIADKMNPEQVILKKDGLKGLIAPWDMIDQKGASEDGVTNVDALQGPTEVELRVLVRGRDPQHCRKTARRLIDSIDKKRTSELSFIDRDQGRWWADVRWFKPPPDIYSLGESRTMDLTLVLRADSGFWQTFPDVDSFGFEYDTDIDTFHYETETGLGAGWKLHYYDGTGDGAIRADGERAVWADDTGLLTDPRGVMCLRAGFETDTDNQVVSVVHATPQESSIPTSCFNDVWGRCSFDGSGNWNGDGIRLRYGAGILRLSRFNNFVETVMREPIPVLNPMVIPPLWGEKFTLVCGYEGDPRLFKVLRNGSEILSHKESGTGSLLGAAYRGCGFGMRAGVGILTQATPGAIRKWSAGDNVTVSQSGFLKRVNVGDQPMPDKYTLYGPGTFRFGNGPGSTDMIEFGPLLPNQVVWIDTDRQRPKIRDLTSVPPTQQELNWFQQALKDFHAWAWGNNVPPLVRQIESQWGIVPPQGNMYSLLKGRWGKESVIPAKSPGAAAQPYFVKVEIDDGNADSKIVVSGTPRRRYPA